ncbi:MAG: IS110 family transposase [Rhizobiales bacterium]|nr:IS110 family transposase [Hyphomicrobiales bacterium]
MDISIIGIDLAKSVFQLHGVDADGAVVLEKKVRRSAFLATLEKLPPCLIGMEACATSHYWARQVQALGHDVRLIPPTYVKPYVQRQKNDAADAAAICEAVSRPHMRKVPIKSEEQQGALVLHRARDLLTRQRTMILNAIRAHLAEFGIVAAQGPHNVVDLIARMQCEESSALPTIARRAILALAAQLASLVQQIHALEQELLIWHRTSASSQRLATIPGIGIITATALAASVPDPGVFKSGRQFAAFLGLVPRQNSSGGNSRLGHISKMGNGYLRKLLVVGATSVLRRARASDADQAPWVHTLLERKPARVVTVAIANKTARTAWALLSHEDVYRRAAA